jgi:hypothetical protein
MYAMPLELDILAVTCFYRFRLNIMVSKIKKIKNFNVLLLRSLTY